MGARGHRKGRWGAVSRWEATAVTRIAVRTGAVSGLALGLGIRPRGPL